DRDAALELLGRTVDHGGHVVERGESAGQPNLRLEAELALERGADCGVHRISPRARQIGGSGEHAFRPLDLAEDDAEARLEADQEGLELGARLRVRARGELVAYVERRRRALRVERGVGLGARLAFGARLRRGHFTVAAAPALHRRAGLRRAARGSVALGLRRRVRALALALAAASSAGLELAGALAFALAGS